MKHFFKYSIGTLLSVFLLSGCINYRKNLNDEVVLKDGNTQTGTIITCDSSRIKLRHVDESISILSWDAIDSVRGKKFKSLFVGANIGYYNIPYFSVFRNQAIDAKQFGFQGKLGIALRGNRLAYLSLLHSPAKPYAVTKVGAGYQRYLGKGSYLGDKGYFVGGEFNLMAVKYNNGPQMTLDPFIGFEKQGNEHIRLHFKLGLQANLSNKNNNTGINASIGIHFINKDFKTYYNTINKEHRIARN
jgi:hypothetical protein